MMERLDVKEQLEMVERIVAASSRTLHAGGEYFVAWGLVAAAIDFCGQLVLDGHLPGAALWATPALIILGIAFSVWRSFRSRRDAERVSLLQREYFRVLYVTVGVTFVAQIAGFRFFANWAQGALWNLAAAMVLFFIGIHGNKRATFAGVVAIGSLAIANAMPAIPGYVLALGMLLAYGGFGLAEMLAHE